MRCKHHKRKVTKHHSVDFAIAHIWIERHEALLPSSFSLSAARCRDHAVTSPGPLRLPHAKVRSMSALTNEMYNQQAKLLASCLVQQRLDASEHAGWSAYGDAASCATSILG
jgi:hypothetical protein